MTVMTGTTGIAFKIPAFLESFVITGSVSP
jgi:hypothetical protein